MMVTLPPDYRPNEDEEFMNPIQVEYFRQKLLRWRADLLVTGLVVGAGTKPLHDLVANIERGKNSKRDSR